MPKKINKLTDAQIAAMPAWRDKWIKIGLCTAPANREKAEAAYRACYRAAKLRDDVPIVWVQNPLVGALAAAISRKILQSSAVRSAVDSAVVSAVRSAVYSAVDSAVHYAVGSAKISWHSWFGGSLWPAWQSWQSFFIELCNLELSDDLRVAAKVYQATVENGGYWWPNADFIIACERPSAINIDDSGRLHCETGNAIEWPDGWGISSWRGVTVPNHWIKNRATLDANEVIKHDNVEVRAAGAAIIGWPKMLSVLKSKIIDDSRNDDIGQLISMRLPGLKTPGHFLKAVCPRNGIIVEGVPKIDDFNLPITTALHAQAWRIGLHPSEYRHPEIRT